MVYSIQTLGLPDRILNNRPCPSVYPYVCPHFSLYVSQETVCINLGHHEDIKVTEPDFLKKSLGKTLISGVLVFLSISLHPVIKMFRNFILVISSQLSKTLRNLASWLPYFLDLVFLVCCHIMSVIFGVLSHYVSSDTVI